MASKLRIASRLSLSLSSDTASAEGNVGDYSQGVLLVGFKRFCICCALFRPEAFFLHTPFPGYEAGSR